MNVVNFNVLLAQVLRWWPHEIVGDPGDFGDPMKSSTIALFYESTIEPLSVKSGSMLLAQLDWILFSVIDDVSRKMIKVHPHDVRRDLLRKKFHELLLKVAVPQLRGEAEWDGSFEKDELLTYLAAEGIPY
jgi:hypothetical protein